MNRLILVSGLSGAGKSTTLNALEDIGFFAVDNIPPPLWPDLIRTLEEARIQNLAIAIDIRSEFFINGLAKNIEPLRESCNSVIVIFLEAASDTLIARFNLTRRNHPLNATSLSRDLDRERLVLAPIRLLADTILDTSNLSAADLTKQLRSQFTNESPFTLRLVSFGYKYGVPTDADILMDVRTFPNPYYESSLRRLPGTHTAVQEYVFARESSNFYEHLRNTTLSFVKRPELTGRAGYTVAIGCTGGRHRSVAVVETMGKDLSPESDLQIIHRDLCKPQIDRTP